MESLYDNFIGPFIFISLISALLFIFILPRTKRAGNIRYSQTFFIITQICGIICTLLGLLAIFTFAADAVKAYWWKIIILPYAYLQIYAIYVMAAKKTLAILDEKQEFNMSSAAGITLGISIVIMGLLAMPLLNSNMLDLRLLFPFYINAVILSFSVVSLFLFKHA